MIQQFTSEPERYAVERRLRERERFLRTLIGNLPGVVYRCRTDENFTSEFISDGCKQLTGFTAIELTQTRTANWEDIIYAEDRERVRSEIRGLMNDAAAVRATPMEASYRIASRDGSIRYVRDRFRFINDADGKIIALEGFIADITERTLAEERLRESEANYRLLAENICDLVCLHEPDGRYTYVSPSSRDLLGYAPDELIGTSPYDYIHPDEIACVRDHTHARLLRGESDLTVNYRMRRKSGEYVWLESMMQIVTGQNGKATQILTVSRDITTRKAAEEKTAAAQEEIAHLFLNEQALRQEAETARGDADRANRAKDEFLQLISHEFRTPLTTIKTLARIMQRDGETPEEKEEYLETIAAECDRQIDMILNLLDVARIEEGSIDLHSERVDVSRLLRSCDKIERHAARAREQNFSVECAANLPPARGDEKAIRRALCSIIENAINYTPFGGAVSITANHVQRIGDASAAGDVTVFSPGYRAAAVAPRIAADNFVAEEIVITVSDNGRGIAAEDIPYIFLKFYRGKNPVPLEATLDGTSDDAMGRAETPGVGLGLYLANRLIKESGGRIEVESEIGRGSRFMIFLPVWNDATDEVDASDEYGFDEGAAR